MILALRILVVCERKSDLIFIKFNIYLFILAVSIIICLHTIYTSTLCMLGNFHDFFVICFFFKINFLENIFKEYHQDAIQFGSSRSGLTCCQV